MQHQQLQWLNVPGLSTSYHGTFKKWHLKTGFIRLLKFDEYGELKHTEGFIDGVPPYAILSHTWSPDGDEVTFDDVRMGAGKNKAGYGKIQFCWQQARKDGLDHIWVDTCCIDKANHTELSEAILSMFHLYSKAEKCYVYLSDVLDYHEENGQIPRSWELAFRGSRWFTRGWTLQELLAPGTVEFFSLEGKLLGSKKTLEGLIREITHIPIPALRGSSLCNFSVDERLRWAAGRNTKRREDKAYCLLGIFDLFMPIIYGEGDHAFKRLKAEINKKLSEKNDPGVDRETKLTLLGSSSSPSPVNVHWTVTRTPNTLFTGREDILQELDSVIRDTENNCTGQVQCRIVITGIGGQGKSEVCLQLALRLRQM